MRAKSCGCIVSHHQSDEDVVKVKRDLSGMTFGRLTVVKQIKDYVTPKGKHYSQWECACQCGKQGIAVIGDNLVKGHTQSCGCYNIDMAKQYNKNNPNNKYNIYELYDNYGICFTEDRKLSWLFDLEDYEKIKNYYWKNSHNPHEYAYAVAFNPETKTAISMSRLVMGANKGQVVDHINHNVSDNRKENLRICTRTQNMMNTRRPTTNTSGHKGVSWNKKKGKWESYIGLNRKLIHLGMFTEINEAIEARQKAEDKYFGDYSYDNSIGKVGDVV